MKITSKTILLILVVFLLGTNLAVIITYQMHIRGEQPGATKTVEVPDSRMGRFFRSELNLDDQQHNKFREFRQSYHRNANSVLVEMQEIRNEMVNVLHDKKPLRSKLDELSDSLGEKHKELKGLTFDYYFNMQSVLNEDQQDKMVEIFQSMLTDEGYAKTPSHSDEAHGHGQNEMKNKQNSSVLDSSDIDVFQDYNE